MNLGINLPTLSDKSTIKSDSATKLTVTELRTRELIMYKVFLPPVENQGGEE